MIQWDDSLSTGLEHIDAQHKELIENFNALSKVIFDPEGREVAGDILDFLQFYSSWHFEREEKCMDEYQCPVAAVNKQAHSDFLETFNQFYKQWWEEKMDAALVEKTYQELKNWIVEHIRGVDVQLKTCLPK
ncbi:MAG: hemerythrin family protein [Chloroflexota bacterium]